MLLHDFFSEEQMLTLEKSREIFILDLGGSENNFSNQWMEEMSAALDEIESTSDPKALVTTASGKFWSSGLDLDWLTSNMDCLNDYLNSVHRLLARVLTLPFHTVAAIQGHCFGGGAMLALAHDFRVMRVDRGYFCLPEVDLKIAFGEGVASLIQAKTSQPIVHRAMTTGHRYGGVEAYEAGLVDAATSESQVLERAVEIAAPLAGKASTALGEIKRVMYGRVYESLCQDV